MREGKVHPIRLELQLMPRFLFFFLLLGIKLQDIDVLLITVHEPFKEKLLAREAALVNDEPGCDV